MTRRAVSISLKIPDNTAYTALVALRRLGVNVDRIERSEISFFDDDCDVETLTDRIIADETMFNPNKHRLTVLEYSAPRAGEVWIEPLGESSFDRLRMTNDRLRMANDRLRMTRRAIAWRLFDANGTPVQRAVLDAAIERLLCNPAIDRAITNGDSTDRDIPVEIG
ncbi:MAG TPA: hypothetical protein VIX60_01120 [Candidatus Cybelea sp.]